MPGLRRTLLEGLVAGGRTGLGDGLRLTLLEGLVAGGVWGPLQGGDRHVL